MLARPSQLASTEKIVVVTLYFLYMYMYVPGMCTYVVKHLEN